MAMSTRSVKLKKAKCEPERSWYFRARPKLDMSELHDIMYELCISVHMCASTPSIWAYCVLSGFASSISMFSWQPQLGGVVVGWGGDGGGGERRQIKYVIEKPYKQMKSDDVQLLDYNREWKWMQVWMFGYFVNAVVIASSSFPSFHWFYIRGFRHRQIWTHPTIQALSLPTGIL